MLGRLLLVMSLLALAGPAQSEPKDLEALRSFRAHAKSPRPAEVVEAVETLRGHECPEAAAELAKLMDSPVEGVRPAALRVLASYSAEATFRPFADEMRHKGTPPERRAALAVLLGRARRESALDAFHEMLREPSLDVRVRYEIARAIAAIGSARACEDVRALLADGRWEVREAAADAVESLALADLGKDLVALILDPEWRVAIAAIRAAARVHPPEAIDPLVQVLRKPGVLQNEAARALVCITDLEFGLDADVWTRQLAKLRENGWRPPTDAELDRAQRSAGRRKYAPQPGREKEFFGAKTTSTSILFVIDVSGSMDELVVERERFKKAPRDWRKLTVVQDELLRIVDALKPETSFNMIAFATELWPWKKGMATATLDNKDSARVWIRALRPLGGADAQQEAASGLPGSASLAAGKTNTYRALLAMFGVDPEKPAPAAAGPLTGNPSASRRDDGPDTVFFLSDGQPSTGKVVDTREIAREVAERNKLQKIVVHTIAIGDFQKDFMKELAHANGGTFVDLGR